MTIPKKRIASSIGLILGAIGFAGCLVAIVGVWGIRGQLRQTTGDVFDRIDSIVLVVRDGVTKTQERVEASKVTTQEIEHSLKTWTKEESSERVTSRLHLGEHTERLALALDEADHWLEMTGSTVDILQKVLSLASSLGAPIDGESVDVLHQEIASLRLRLTEANELVTEINQRTIEPSNKEPLQEPIQKAIELSVRVVATVGAVDLRLREFETKLSAAQSNLHDWRTRTLGWIFVVTIGVTLLSLWMAAGQAALFRFAWSRLRQTPSDSK